MTTVAIPNQRVKRKAWTIETTLAFLECYLSRKDEFQYKRKKRFVYEKILKEMVSRGLLDSSTTHVFLETKIQTLRKAYRAGKLNGKDPKLTHYMDLIFTNQAVDSKDDIYEDKTMSSSDIFDEKNTEMNCNYKERDWSCPTLNLGGIPTNPLGDDSTEKDFPSSSADLAEFLNSPVDIKSEIPSRCASPANPSLPHKSKKSTQVPPNGMKRLSREMYYAEKLDLNAQKFEARMEQKRKFFNDMLQTSERRFREAEKAKTQRHREKMDFFRRLMLK